MRVLLMGHPISVDKEQEDEFGAYPPLGLAYLAAMLLPEGHDVAILDCLAEGFAVRSRSETSVRIGLTDEEIARRIKEFAPDLIGISGNFTPFTDEAMNLARLAKETMPGVTVVLGGAHFTMEYLEAMTDPSVDLVIRGEGEYAIRDLAAALSSPVEERPKRLAAIQGLVWRRDGEVAVNPLAEPISDLDALPQPAYDALNMDAYLRQHDRTFAFCKNFPVGHMITSRGCLFKCIFCSTTNNGRTFRARSAEKVLDEIEFLVRRYGVREIHFHDDSMINDEQRIRDICHGMIERNIQVSWQISQGVTVWKMTPDLLRLMHASGMYRVGFPIESGSKKTLKFIRKPVNLDRSREIIRECQRLGIYTHGNFIIGFPYETGEEIAETEQFMIESGLDVVKLLVAQPLAGSDMYELYKREGLFEKLIHSSTYCKTKYDTLHFTADALNQMRHEMMARFVARRMRSLITPKGFASIILPKLNSPDKFRYFFRMSLLMLKKRLRNEPVFGV